MVSCDWFKLMLSIPPREPLTGAAVFVQWSSMIAYNLFALTVLAAPQTWKGPLQLEFSGRTEGYFQLQAVALFELGFLYIIFARSKFDVPGNMQPFSNFSRNGKCPGLMVGWFFCIFCVRVTPNRSCQCSWARQTSHHSTSLYQLMGYFRL